MNGNLKPLATLLDVAFDESTEALSRECNVLYTCMWQTLLSHAGLFGLPYTILFKNKDFQRKVVKNLFTIKRESAFLFFVSDLFVSVYSTWMYSMYVVL